MTTRLLLAAAAVAVGSVAQAQYVPYYGYGYNTTVNPFNGTLTQSAATVNPFTGAPAVVSNGYNPYTGAVGQTVAQYNPYTGTTVRQDQAYNPFTGAGYNFVRAYNPYLTGGYGYNPYLGATGYNPGYYPSVGGVRLPAPAATAPQYYPWNTTAKPNTGTVWMRR